MEGAGPEAADQALGRRLLYGWALNGALLLGSLAAFLILRLQETPAAGYVPWWTVALAIAATEAITVDVDFERQPFTFSISALPLVVGLAFLSPIELGLVFLAGAGGVIVGDRGKPAPRVAENVASLLFYNCVTAVVYRSVLGDASPVQPIGWAAAGGVMIAQLVVSNMVAEVGIALESGRFSLHSNRRTFVVAVVIEVVATAAGLLLVVVLWHQPGAVWIPLILVAALIAVLRIVTRASRRAAKLELLSEFMAQRSLDSVDLMTSLLARVKQLLHCRVAEIVVVAGSHREGAFRLVLGPEGGATVTTPSTAELERTLAGRVAMMNASIIVARHTSSEDLIGLLPRDAAMGAVAVPLRAEKAVLGAIGAADRTSLKVFDVGDRELLETVASHAGAVIENSLLLERLHREAAAKEHEATHDALTGCANRTLFRRRLEEALERAIQDGSLVGVLVIDLDHFKQINDREGHHAGDAVLVEIAARLEAAVPAGATVGRLGGDEFAIVVPGIERAGAAAELAARLVEEVGAPVELEHATVSVRPSIGEAAFPDHVESSGRADVASLLLRHADQAMYRAKGRRSGHVVYEGDDAGSVPVR
jgi:diguanylate cyclase (GGDEF)-like protein